MKIMFTYMSSPRLSIHRYRSAGTEYSLKNLGRIEDSIFNRILFISPAKLKMADYAEGNFENSRANFKNYIFQVNSIPRLASL